MKKLIGAILTFSLIILTVFSFSVSATGSLELSTETKTVDCGENISITVTVTSNSGFALLILNPEYDKENLELINTEKGNVCSGGYVKGLNPYWSGNGSNVTETGTLITFTFRAKDNAKIKDYDVGVVVRECWDENEQAVTVNAPMGKIQINHNFGDFSSVDENGHQRECAKCHLLETDAHNFSDWESIKEAACTENGATQHKCSICQNVEEKEISALGHDFESSVIVKEATISSTGLVEGKCKRCGEITSEIIPCNTKDETTDISFETQGGVLPEETEISVNIIEKSEDESVTAETVLKDVSDKFTLYSISASVNGSAVTPNGKVETTFTVPEDYGETIKVYLIKPDETKELIESVTDQDNKTVTAVLSDFGTYAICDSNDEINTGVNSDIDDSKEVDTNSNKVDDNDSINDDEKHSNYLIWTVALAVALLVLVAIVIVVFKNKKTKQ